MLVMPLIPGVVRSFGVPCTNIFRLCSLLSNWYMAMLLISCSTKKAWEIPLSRTQWAHVKKGCSLGSFLYCLAIHPVLQQLRSEFPDLLILAYCDDVHVVGSPERAIKAYKRWAHLYGSILQGELRDDKGVAFSPTVSEPQLRSLGLPASMPFTNSGVRILGAPVGSVDFCHSFALEITEEIRKDFGTLGRMPSFQAQQLVATTSVVHQIDHLLRNIPGGEIDLFGDVAMSYDATVLSVVRRITGCVDLPDVALRICQLPSR